MASKPTTLTDAAIKRIALPKAGRIEKFDRNVPSFGVRVTDKGRKSFFVFVRVKGKEKMVKDRLVKEPLERITIGEWTDCDSGCLAKARAKAQHYKELARNGIDPRVDEAERQQAEKQERETRAANSFEAVVGDYIEKDAKVKQRRWKETERTLLVNCAAWKARPIVAITKKDAYALLEGFVAAGKPYKAARTLSWLKTLWRWAAKRDIVSAPIMDAVEIAIEQKHRTRCYSDDEIKAIWKATDGLGKRTGPYVKLLLLLCTRKNELAGMRRSEIDDDNLWTIPTERTKTAKKAEAKGRVYPTPLPALAQRIVKGIPQESNEAEADLVFPGAKKGKPFVPGAKLQKAIQEASGVADFDFHACRHTVATWLQKQNHSQYERSLVLNHSETGVTADYSHGYPLSLKRELLEEWAGHIGELTKPGANVERLRG